MPLALIASHAGAGALVLVIAFACFAFGWIGGGDAKLAAAAALWFGFDHLLDYLVYASLFGGAPDAAAVADAAVAAALCARAAKNGCCVCTIRRPAFPTASRSRSAR